jgi:transcriptional regulator with XRE-family HTH domain
MSDILSIEKVHGYEIKKSVLFENDRGFALAENQKAPQPFVTWQFTEENGRRDYYWGHYTQKFDAAAKDFEARVTDYQKSYGVSEKSMRPAPEFYKYYSTQRPVDIGTFPKTENGPAEIVNFDKRESVESGRFLAWGYLLYHAPLTEKQMFDYELRAAPGNPDQFRLTSEQLEQQAQVVGKWEQEKHIPDGKRLTWWYPDFGVFVKNELIPDAELSERYEKVMESKARSARKIPIAEWLKEGAERADKDNAAHPAPVKNTEKDR